MTTQQKLEEQYTLINTDMYLTGTTFINNFASSEGGAMYTTQSQAIITMTDTSFINW